MTTSDFSLPTICDGEDKTSPLKNRVRKNYRHIRKWAKRTFTNCFRIYDREIREYPLAIDFYDGRFCVHYFAHFSDEVPQELFEETQEAICSLFGVSAESIFWRTRMKRERMQQYEKTSDSQAFFTVLEYGKKFKVNLVDYIDTGLFLDHRETRQMVASLSSGKRLLNLFAYTCSFSVHAALRGAVYTKSVDMSNTYTRWGRENFDLNAIAAANHPIVRADCVRFLEEETLSNNRYDLIVIDPPTISRSKKMDQMFDIQYDYIPLISQCLELLCTSGIIFFSTNSRSFHLDTEAFASCEIVEISKKTVPLDFHNQKIHRCWKISPKTETKK